MSSKQWLTKICSKMSWPMWFKNLKEVNIPHMQRSILSYKNVIFLIYQSVIFPWSRCVQLQHRIGYHKEVHWEGIETSYQQYKIEKSSERKWENKERRNHRLEWENQWGENKSTWRSQGCIISRISWDILWGEMVGNLWLRAPIIRSPSWSRWRYR